MDQPGRISRKALAGFFAGVLGMVSGFLALVSRSDLLLLGIPVFLPAAIILGVQGYREANRHPDRWRGGALALWGIGLPLCGFCLGFLPGDLTVYCNKHMCRP